MSTGRPTKLNERVMRQIADLVAAGVYLEAAAESIGVSRSTLHRWLGRGRIARSGIYREFILAVDVAAAKAETVATLEIRRAGSRGEWRASLAWLTRRVPDRWAAPRIAESEFDSAEDAAARIREFLRAANASIPSRPEVSEIGNRATQEQLDDTA